MSEPLPDNAPTVITIEEPQWDLASSARFAKLLEPARDRPDAIIDMSRVDYIDSSCLGKLVALRSRRPGSQRDRGRIVVTSPSLRRVFEIVQFDKLWKLFFTLDEAIRDATNPGGRV